MTRAQRWTSLIAVALLATPQPAPAAKAGRLAVDLHPWYVSRGAIPPFQPKVP